jgi:hypothetical protein
METRSQHNAVHRRRQLREELTAMVNFQLPIVECICEEGKAAIGKIEN